MKLYRVYVREIWIQEYVIDATSEEDAKEKILAGGGNAFPPPTYSHTPDDDSIANVEEID